MNILNRFYQLVILCASTLLLCIGLNASADEIQDINKLFKQGQYDPALEQVNTYLAAKPKDAQARFLKGLILTEQGKANDAIVVFSGLTEDYPELPEPYNNLAVLYAGQGLYDKARISLEMAIRTHPSYATAHENLGDIYAKMASQAYDRALQLDRSNSSTQTKLSLIKDLFTGGTKGSKTSVVSSKQSAKPKAAAEGVATAPESTATAKQTGAVATGDNSEILQTVQDWAAAWSAKNVDAYLAFYAVDFKTPDGQSRKGWEDLRRDRVSTPKFIQIGIGNPKVSLSDDSHASVTFQQSYRANHLNTASKKTLQMIKVDGKWQILEERSGR